MKKRIIKLIAIILPMVFLLSGCGRPLIPLDDMLNENEQLKEWYHENIISTLKFLEEKIAELAKKNPELTKKIVSAFSEEQQMHNNIETFFCAMKDRDIEAVNSIFSEYAQEFDGYYENMNAAFDFIKGDLVSIKYDCRGGFSEYSPDNIYIWTFYVVTTTEEEYLVSATYTPLVEGDKQGKQKGMKEIHITKLSDYDNYYEREGEHPHMGEDEPILIWRDPEATE